MSSDGDADDLWKRVRKRLTSRKRSEINQLQARAYRSWNSVSVCQLPKGRRSSLEGPIVDHAPRMLSVSAELNYGIEGKRI
jgi:hypothetical protein